MPEFLHTITSSAYSAGGITLTVLVSLFIFWQYRRREEKNIIDAFLKAASVPLFSTSLAHLKSEVSRSRRYQHELSVLIFRLLDAPEISLNRSEASARSAKNGKMNAAPGMSRLEFLLLGPILKDAVRTIDLVTYDAGNNQFIIVLPESSKINAVQAANRLKKMLGSKIMQNLAIGIAEFPKDGLIIEDLIARATPGQGEASPDLPGGEQAEEIRQSNVRTR